MMFIHSKESVVLKVCDLIFGVPTLSPAGSMLEFVDPIIIALPLAVVATVVVQILTRKNQYSDEHLQECFKGI